MSASTDHRRCWRCGVDFNGWYLYVTSAPCADCRSFLRTDGDTTVWLRPKASETPSRELVAA